MERLEPKKISGHTYYWYSGWGWKDGRCRRLWQKYLGKLEDIVKAVEGGGPPPAYAEVFDFGLTEAFWGQIERSQVVQTIDQLCPKRDQGLSVGQYLAIAATNRAVDPVSKRAMWEWFGATTLLRRVPGATREAMGSQRFWDHMKKLTREKARQVWQKLIGNVFERGQLDLSDICYDGTNFYTFINTFNVRSRLAQRGKNKQGRSNLRQVSYALFCTRDGGIPLFYDLYEGNFNAARQFPIMCRAFAEFIAELTGRRPDENDTTLIFDKGNNSLANVELLDELNFRFIGSVKLDEHRDLAEISNRDDRFTPCRSPELAGIKAFETTRQVYGQDRRVVVAYNQELFDTQWRTLHNDIDRALDALAELKQRLDDRAHGLIKGGRAPTTESVLRQCDRIRSRQYLKRVLSAEVSSRKKAPRLVYHTDAEALAQLADTYLGKKLIVSNDTARTTEELIVAYHSQYVIEDVFKKMKDRKTGCWWPLYHWTDSQVRVHGLYCTMAALLRALTLQRLRRAGMNISMRRMLRELSGIREVINVFPAKRRKPQRTQTVLSKTNEVQRRMLEILELQAD
jgi:transposase